MLRSALATSAARRFFAAHAQSSLGTGLALLALPLIAIDRFGSPMAISAVLLPELLPAIVVGRRNAAGADASAPFSPVVGSALLVSAAVRASRR